MMLFLHARSMFNRMAHHVDFEGSCLPLAIAVANE